MCDPWSIIPCGGYECGGLKICINGEVWSDCTSGAHTECVEQTCQCVDGAGVDECFSDSDCEEHSNPFVSSLSGNAGNYCVGIQGAGIAVFEWVYYDPDNDVQAQYEFQIDNNSDFSSPEVDRIATSIYSGISSGDTQQQLVLVKTINTTSGCDYIKYGVNYYWRVKTIDVTGGDSGWVYYNGPTGAGTSYSGGATTYSFGYSHPAPSPFVTYFYEGDSLQPAEDTLFSDTLSVCYGPSGVIDCRLLENCYGGQCYIWAFGDQSAYDYTVGETTHSYSGVGNYNASLTICDEIGCCSSVTNVPVGLESNRPVPQWREITPF